MNVEIASVLPSVFRVISGYYQRIRVRSDENPRARTLLSPTLRERGGFEPISIGLLVAVSALYVSFLYYHFA